MQIWIIDTGDFLNMFLGSEHFCGFKSGSSYLERCGSDPVFLLGRASWDYNKKDRNRYESHKQHKANYE